MNKPEIIYRLSLKNQNKTLREITKFVDTFFDILKEHLIEEKRIELRGFGSLCVRHYEPYYGRNPKTGEPIFIPQKKLPYWKTGLDLRERVDEL